MSFNNNIELQNRRNKWADFCWILYVYFSFAISEIIDKLWRNYIKYSNICSCNSWLPSLFDIRLSIWDARITLTVITCTKSVAHSVSKVHLLDFSSIGTEHLFKIQSNDSRFCICFSWIFYFFLLNWYVCYVLCAVFCVHGSYLNGLYC